MKPLLAALQFLTVLPLSAVRTGERDLARSVWCFPLAGLLIGAAAAGLDYEAARLFPPLARSVLTVGALLAASGGLHLDGLADTADGFFSSRPRERILEIMKDSRSGPMAIAAVVWVLALKITALAAVPAQWRWQTVLMMAAAGRCALVWQLNVLPYARKEGGLGSVFQKERGPVQVLWSLLILAGAGWLTMAWAGVAVCGAALIAAALFCVWCHRKIGGLTGDTLGALCELTEAVVPLAVTAMASQAGGGAA